MNNADKKIIMTLNIGGERFDLNVPFHSQKRVRDAEKAADSLADYVRKSFPMASDASVLARVAYQLASKYLQLFNENSEALYLAREAALKMDALSSLDLKKE